MKRSSCVVLLVLASLVFADDLYAQEEKHNTGWELYVDNDVLTTGDADEDYTGGGALSLSGRRAATYPFSLNRALNKVDKFTRFQKLYETKDHFQLHSIEFGLTLFTPRDIEISAPIENDHPYASLLFMANTRQTIMPERDITYRSGLTVGFLGLPVGREIQQALHRATDAEKPRGWDNQISDGGEPTAKYTVSVQKNWKKGRYEFNTSVEGNIGFSTDVNVGLSWRWGRIRTPWWSFNPEQADYLKLGSPVSAQGRKRGEFYVLAGANIRLRLYNAILQGQFRDSEVELSRSDLKDFIGEAWVGFSKQTQIFGGYRFTFLVRARTKEIKGPNAREPVWGALVLTKVF